MCSNNDNVDIFFIIKNLISMTKENMIFNNFFLSKTDKYVHKTIIILNNLIQKTVIFSISFRNKFINFIFYFMFNAIS